MAARYAVGHKCRARFYDQPAAVYEESYSRNGLNQVTYLYDVPTQTVYSTLFYDNNGNLTLQYFQANAQHGEQYIYFDYDYENRLIKVTYPNGGTTEFAYDALGRRLKTTEKNSAGTPYSIRQFVYDGLDVIAELDGADATVAAYTHGPGIDDPVGVRLYSGGAADYFYHKNHQGSITEITDINGNISKMYKYDAYGRKYFETGPPLVDEFAYTARERHDRTGLSHYRNRFYYAQIGRFISQDPIGIAGGANLYAYVGNDPVNWNDPLGLQSALVNPFLIQANYASGLLGEAPQINAYGDVNITVPISGLLHGTGGVMAHPDTGIHGYGGLAIASGPGIAVTAGPLQEPTPGLNYGFQAGFVGGFQAGYAQGTPCGGDEGTFLEFGVMTPGIALGVYYVTPGLILW